MTNSKISYDKVKGTIQDASEKEKNFDQSLEEAKRYQENLHDKFLYQKLILREQIQKKCFQILWTELIFLGFLILLQGFGKPFHFFIMNDWVIGVISSGCIAQTFLIIKYITLSLFPNDDGIHFKRETKNKAPIKQG